MKLFRGAPTPFEAADPATFVGNARLQRLAADDEAVAVHVYRVEFADGGRTNWHTHSGPQWLFVIEGRIRVQRAGAPAEDLDAGDAAVFSPGEKHWHGATPRSRGTHIAVNIAAKTEWLEPVSEDQYVGGRP
jgi:quercetin dioxygenase-like cupin family protein